MWGWRNRTIPAVPAADPVFDRLFDDGQERDIWYASILHFAAPVPDPAGLLGWAERNRASLTHEVTLDSLSLTRSRYRETDGRRHMAMEPWHTTALAG